MSETECKLLVLDEDGETFDHKAEMLKGLDELRLLIENGDVTGFSAVGIKKGGGNFDYHSAFRGQKSALAGMLLSKAVALSISNAPEEVAEALGIEY